MLRTTGLRVGRDFRHALPPQGLPRSAHRSTPIENGNGEMKVRALPHFALDPDAATVNFDEMFGDGQAQAGAADFARAGNVNPVEALEDARLVRPRDADSSVGDREGHFGAVGGRADHDLTAGRSVLHGVVQQILENFGKTAAVSGDVRQWLLQIHGDTQILFESMSKSSVSRARRRECSRIISRKRTRFCESSIAPARSVSAKPWMAVSGVRNSWETLATKSRRTRSSLRSSVMSWSTMTAPEVSAARTEATVAAKKC